MGKIQHKSSESLGFRKTSFSKREMHEHDAQLQPDSLLTWPWSDPTWSLLQSFAVALMSLQRRYKVDKHSLELGR